MATGQDVINVGQQHLGEDYFWSYRVNNNNPNDRTYAIMPDTALNNANYAGPWDCAEFVTYCVYRAYGLKYGLINSTEGTSFQESSAASWLQDATSLTSQFTEITLSAARDTVGAILIATSGSHVALSAGDGRILEANVDRTGSSPNFTYYRDRANDSDSISHGASDGVAVNPALYGTDGGTPLGQDIGDVKFSDFGWPTSGYRAFKINVVDYGGGGGGGGGDSGNTFATATLHTLPYTSTNASVGSNGDTDDFIKFVATGNGTVTANLSGLSADIDLFAYNSNQSQIASSEVGGTANESIQFSVSAGQTYFVRVDPFNTAASNYLLTVNFTGSPQPNQNPDARNDQFSAQRGQMISGNVLVNNGSGADSDPDNDPLTVDSLNNVLTAAGGRVTLNGNGSFQYTAPSSGTSDSFSYTLRDGRGGSDPATVTINLTAPANQNPDARNDQFSATRGQTINGSVLINNGSGADSDPDSDPLTVDFLNNALTSAGGRVTLNSNGSFQYTAPSSGSSDSFSYTLRDGRGGSDSATVTIGLTAPANNPPVATINNHSLALNQWSQVANWISYSDANGNPATHYAFADSGTGASSGYFLTPADAHHAAETTFVVAASDLANVWVRGGATAGSETMWVAAFDGTDWSAWDSFTLTSVGNNAPVATINDHSVALNQWSQVANWLSYSDANGNPATHYAFFDSGTGALSGYFLTPANAHHAAETTFVVAASDLANVWVRGGATGGSETMWVAAFDGTDWSAWDSFTLTSVGNNAPVATINDHSLALNQWSQVANWISYSDANGNPATHYAFFDSGTGASSGYFLTPADAHHAAESSIVVGASDLANVWVRGGTTPGSETMWVAAFDGTDWSAWDSFTLTSAGNNAPVATINDHSLALNQWSQVANWISYSDANGNPATHYAFFDSGTGASSGYFLTPADAHHAAESSIVVGASDLANVWVRGGTTPGSETMWVAAFDGTDWSAWDSFTLISAGNNAPVATISDHSLALNQWSQVANWISYSDANGNPATHYAFFDSGTGASSGYFLTPADAHHAAEASFVVAASDLANVWVRGGATAGSETMWVAAFDGTDWSAWDPFLLITV